MTLQTSLATKIYHLSPFVQQLSFPQVAFFTTANELSLLAAGTYPPQIRIFDLPTTSLRTQRNLKADAVHGQLLYGDWKKIALLLENREIEIHGYGGVVFSHRIPYIPRAGIYDPFSATYLACGDSNNLIGLDLSNGKFMSPLVGRSQTYEALALCEYNALIYAGGLSGISAFDVRQGIEIAHLVNEPTPAIAVSPDGMRVAAGTYSGKVTVYDVRSATPMQIIESSQNAVRQVQFHRIYDNEYIISHDGKQIRGYDNERALKFYIDTLNQIQHFYLFPRSGLIMASCQAEVIYNYYVPDMGAAPAWATDLESYIESINTMSQQAYFENCRFITEYELKTLNLQQLAKTDAVVPQMHGFWIKNDIYQRAIQSREAQDPEAEEHELQVKEFRNYREGIDLASDAEEPEETIDERFLDTLREIAGQENGRHSVKENARAAEETVRTGKRQAAAEK